MNQIFYIVQVALFRARHRENLTVDAQDGKVIFDLPKSLLIGPQPIACSACHSIIQHNKPFSSWPKDKIYRIPE